MIANLEGSLELLKKDADYEMKMCVKMLILAAITIFILQFECIERTYKKGSYTPEESIQTVEDLAIEPNKNSPPVPTVESRLIAHMTQYISTDQAERYASLIVRHSATYEVDPYVICAMIQVESFFDQSMIGKHNDTGLLQVLPPTQKFMNISGDLLDPSINIEVGTKYLQYCQNRFGFERGSVAYNQGEGNVLRGTYNTKYLVKVKNVVNSMDDGVRNK